MLPILFPSIRLLTIHLHANVTHVTTYNSAVMESSRLETLPEPLRLLHHADVVYREIRSICGCAVKRNPDQPRVSRPEEVINRPTRCRIYRGSCGDEPHRMSLEPLATPAAQTMAGIFKSIGRDERGAASICAQAVLAHRRQAVSPNKVCRFKRTNTNLNWDIAQQQKRDWQSICSSLA